MGIGERLIHLSALVLHPHSNVGAYLLMQYVRIFRSPVGVDEGIERLVVNIHQLSSIKGRIR